MGDMDAGKESDLQSLLERLEKASGGDREIDAALHVALLKPEQYPDDLRYYRLPSPSMDHMEMCAPGTYWLKQRSGASLHTAPNYTSSLDAALSLVERVMPGCGVEVLASDRDTWRATVWPWVSSRGTRADIGFQYSYAKAPALALCLALVRAKLEDEKGNDRE
ncbi:MAG: hypothetical protein BroJett013_06740 [Alphaproteobacteria bacterium]|nr:MAG: hypothetical protein BroJett013_06740 [Alphaproteobacteria bacterium]